MDTNFQPVISAKARSHCRHHPLEFKRALVVLSLEPGASVARIAREHHVNANQVFSWRRLYQQGRLGPPVLMRDDGLLPVVLLCSLAGVVTSSNYGGGPAMVCACWPNDLNAVVSSGRKRPVAR